MTRRRRSDRFDGSLLDAPPAVDATAWETNTVLTPLKKAADPPACCCPPPSPHRLGGCRPVLVLKESTLTPICATCQKGLIPGRHRRRDQSHVLGLAALGAERLDLEDLREVGLLVTGDSPPAPTPTP